MQRVKGQTSSVPNSMREIKDERQDTWRTQANQAYNSTLPASNMSDPYMQSYYAAPVQYSCLNQGIGDGRWSNGGDPLAYLSSCGGQIGGDQTSHYMDPMFSQNNFNNFSQGFAFFHSAGTDYSAWGNSAHNTRKATTQGDNRDDYYGRELYNPAAYQPTAVKHLERQMEGLSLQTHQNSFAFFKDSYGKPDAMIAPETHSAGHHFSKKHGIFPMPSSGITLGEQPMVPKQTSWATVASKPAKPQPKPQSKSIPSLPVHSDKNNTTSMDIGTWENKNGNSEGNSGASGKIELLSSQTRSSPWTSPRGNRHLNNHQYDLSHSVESNITPPVLDKLYLENNYNPKDFNYNPENARFFIIKSYSEDDVHRSIKYSIWCSTEHGNKRLDTAFRESEGKVPIYLLYSVNGSGHFCGMAEMVSHVDYNSNSSIWAQDKWKGQFKVKWIYVKDVPNVQLRHIRLENNENKPVTNSRDTQEVPLEKGKQMLKIIHNYNSVTSIFDDFSHYEKRQQEEEKRKTRGGHTRN